MEGLSRHLHKQSSIKLHSKLKPPFGENLGESEKLCWVWGENSKRKGQGVFLPRFFGVMLHKFRLLLEGCRLCHCHPIKSQSSETVPGLPFLLKEKQGPT